MPTTLAVSPKGQITLPSALRKKYGIAPGGLLKIEESAGKLVLSPAVAVEIEIYSDDQIARLSKEDEWKPGERKRWLKRVARKKP